jgi:hypothetical protein
MNSKAGAAVSALLLLSGPLCHCGGETQEPDAAVGDAQKKDAGNEREEAGIADAAVGDAGVEDAGDAAAGPADSGTDDTGVPDAGFSEDPLSKGHLIEVVTVLASDEMNGREPGTEGWRKARAYVEEQMSMCGIQPAGPGGFEQPVEGGKGINILGRIEGSESSRRERVVILGAHYDHIGDCGGQICNGAYDNATSVAVALGIGCTLVRAPAARTVLVAIWDTEEPPAFLTDQMGSQYYAAHPIVPLAKTDAAVTLDLLGEGLWEGHMGHFLMGAELSPQVVAAVDAALVPAGLKAYRAGLHLAEESRFGHQAWSDYDAFRNLNVPILFASDGQNKRYHTPEDETAGVDFEKLVLEARYLGDIVARMGNAATDPVFVADGTDYGRDVATLMAVSEDVLAPGGMADALSLSTASRDKLKADRAAVEDAKNTLDGGGNLTFTQIQALRGATQRVMCLAGNTYNETICNML